MDACYTSAEWREDYEADERGEIPPDLTRGVLSQDVLFDLLVGVETIASVKEQTKVGMAFLRVPTNTLTHNPRSPVAEGFSQLSC